MTRRRDIEHTNDHSHKQYISHCNETSIESKHTFIKTLLESTWHTSTSILYLRCVKNIEHHAIHPLARIDSNPTLAYNCTGVRQAGVGRLVQSSRYNSWDNGTIQSAMHFSSLDWGTFSEPYLEPLCLNLNRILCDPSAAVSKHRVRIYSGYPPFNIWTTSFKSELNVGLHFYWKRMKGYKVRCNSVINDYPVLWKVFDKVLVLPKTKLSLTAMGTCLGWYL